MDTKEKHWNESYLRNENFLWEPHDEVIRFVSKYIFKRVDINEYHLIRTIDNPRILLFGCGIGRHAQYLKQVSSNVIFGIDISSVAITKAKQWAILNGYNDLADNLLVVDGVSDVPFEDNSFDYVISHGVFDSMSFELAKKNMLFVNRVLIRGGLFYLDLVSEANTELVCSEYEVETLHEKGTIQSHYNLDKLNSLLAGSEFRILELNKVDKTNLLETQRISDYILY